MSNNLSKKVTSGLFWSFGERILAQGVSFVVSIVLARILVPAEYGIISMVLVFINIANVFVSNGLGESLIQKKDSDEKDFATIFTCGFVLSILLYFLLFFIAPFISAFYKNSLLTSVIRVLSIKLPIASVNGIQKAYVSKHMQFKKFFFSTLAGTVISGVIGILLALAGYGVWALVAQYLINSTVDTLVLLITVVWKPRLYFSKKSAKNLLGFGFKMMLSALINTVYSEMQSLVIGKKYTPNDLAYYKRGNQFPSLFITNICSAVSTVLFPTMANESNSIADVKKMTRKSLQITSYIITPLMIGLIAIADPLVRVVLTDKWLPCVPYLQLLCLAYLFQPVQTANCQAIKAVGRGDVYFWTEIIKKSVGVVLLLIALMHGVMAIAIAFVVTVMISSVITMVPNVTLLKYSIKEQIMDLMPSFVFSGIMFAAVYPISKVSLAYGLVMSIQIVVAVFLYVGMSYVFKEKSFLFLISFAKTKR